MQLSCLQGAQNDNAVSTHSFIYYTAQLSLYRQAGSDRLKHSDALRINSLSLNVYFRDGSQWPSQAAAPILQPVKLSLTIARDLNKPAKTDDLADTLDYSSLASALVDSSNNATFGSLEELVDEVFSRSFDKFVDIQDMSVRATKTKALLRGKAVTLSSFRSRGIHDHKESTFMLEDLEVSVIIGIHPEERIQKQMVRLNLTLSDQVSRTTVNYRFLAEQIHNVRRFKHAL
jgi:dihydroneopterin aldolase / 2-amino-4-hydroxy-6-hydroxymethyldihydropteridine diphosphokinase / dihydropteroate synthase